MLRASLVFAACAGVLVTMSVPVREGGLSGAAVASDTTPGPAVIPLDKGTIYVLATGADAGLRTKALAAFMLKLQQTRDAKDLGILLPEPDWSENDYVAACRKDPDDIHGAFVISILENGSYSVSHFVVRSQYTYLAAMLRYARCDKVARVTTTSSPSASPSAAVPVASTASPNRSGRPRVVVNLFVPPTEAPKADDVKGKAVYGWQSPVVVGAGIFHVNQSFQALSYLISFAALYAAISPSKSTSTVSTRNFPTPSPFNQGYQSSTATTVSSATNSSQFATTSLTLLGSSLNYNNAVAQLPTGDLNGWNAVVDATGQIVDQFMDCAHGQVPLCKPKPTPSPSP